MTGDLFYGCQDSGVFNSLLLKIHLETRIECLVRVFSPPSSYLFTLGENSMQNLKNLRSEEHTSELQSRPHLVCRLLLEKKKNKTNNQNRCTHHRRAHTPLRA